ncbi:MAG: phosphotransferase [Solobacterium sp.]|nr:phosphotransferase [Solobacterium sp.]
MNTQSKDTHLLLPDEIRTYTEGLSYVKDVVGRSGDSVFLFEDRYVLKVSEKTDGLKREMERTDFLAEHGIPGCRSICFAEEGGRAYYLRTCLRGISLIDRRYLRDPELLAEKCAEAVNVLKSLDGADCPFCSPDSNGSDFIHGDLCLPNLYFNEQGKFIGFIDLDGCGKGDRWYDYAWLIWSWRYNLKTTAYDSILLEKLGIRFSEEQYERYIPAGCRGSRSAEEKEEK